MLTPKIILLLNFAATWFMVGLIWIVQVVHYPLFAGVGEEMYQDYQQKHQLWITFVVGPAMLLELATAVMLIYSAPLELPLWAPWAGIGLIFVVWLSTALLQVPCHAKLEQGFDEAAHRFLVNSNWIRTVGWSLRGVLTGWMVWEILRFQASGPQ